jgi:hypothetical protein
MRSTIAATSRAAPERSTHWTEFFSEAAEGTRTLDLLHGKRTYIEMVDRPFTCKSG